jgi:alpha-tubulin suppressor-like RCC1 family protein
MNSNTPVQIISSGSCHTIAMNSKGKIFSWGWNNYSQCGIPFYTSYNRMFIPKLIRDKKGNIPGFPVVNYISAKQVNNEDFNMVKQIVCGEHL